MITEPAADVLRCSAWSRSVGLDPIGSVGSYREFLLVETPLPWPRDVGEIPALAALGAPGRRVQALVPAGDGPPEVVLYTAPEGPPFSGYIRHAAPQGDSPASAVAALTYVSTPVSTETESDVLVCTHGRRDVCCGSLGTELALALSTHGGREGVRFWRTSHTGGHRFAPTLIILPQGTAWAYADQQLVASVLDRRVPFAQVAGHYRGCAGLPGAQVQALEREVLSSVGWELMDRPRWGFATAETSGGSGAVVRLEAGSDRWEAVVRPGRTLPVPDCGRPLSEAHKTETEWVVSDLRPVR